MKNSKLTKLVALAAVLALSVAGLAGSTIAWFTDTETSLNTIQSGSLDIELQFKQVGSGTVTGEWIDTPMEWTETEANTPIFNENALYEPGYTEVALLKIVNAGDLSLQYKLSVDANNTVVGESVQDANGNSAGDPIYLSDHLKLAAIPVEIADMKPGDDGFDAAVLAELGATDGKLTREGIRSKLGDSTADATDGTTIPYISEGFKDVARPAKDNVSSLTEQTKDIAPVVINKMAAGGTAEPITNIELWPGNADKVEETYDLYALVLWMPEEVGNEANYRNTQPKVDLGIKLEAAQVVEEADSFGNDYDETATYDDGTVGGDGAAKDGYEPADSGNGGNSGIEAVELPFELIVPATMQIEVSDGTLDGSDTVKYTTTPNSPQAVDILNTNADEATKGSMTLASSELFYPESGRVEQIRLPENTAVTLTDSCLPGNNGDGTFVLIVPENTSVYLDGANTRVSMSDSALPFGSASLKGKFILYEGTDKEKAEEINNSIGDAFQGFYYGTDTSNYQCLKYREDAA